MQFCIYKSITKKSVQSENMPITSITTATNRNDDDEVSTTTAELMNNWMENFVHISISYMSKKNSFPWASQISIPIPSIVKCFRQLYKFVLFLSLFCRLQFNMWKWWIWLMSSVCLALKVIEVVAGILLCDILSGMWFIVSMLIISIESFIL